MAGPGGGPPRRSHTKSRKGCDNCKKRHIRCDENFPQCRNCTKHKVRCSYQDAPDEGSARGSASPPLPDLMWTREIADAIEKWKQFGAFPFPSLNLYPAPIPANYSGTELRLIYHLGEICNKMCSFDGTKFTLWTKHIPTMLQIGACEPYVMHALLAFSAMHVAYQTDCPRTGNLAYEHRGKAIAGLGEALKHFSSQNSDGALATSLLLSWQATDWRDWSNYMHGTTSVIGFMDEWKATSIFKDLIAESEKFPVHPPAPRPEQSAAPQPADMEAFQRLIVQLGKVETYLKQNKEDTKLTTQLSTFLKGCRKVSSIKNVSDQFDRLQPLRAWLFWIPVRLLQDMGTSPNALVTIAHFYTAAMLMERLFPEIGAAFFGTLSIQPVHDINMHLLNLRSGVVQGGVEIPLQLMDFPLATMNEYRERMGWDMPYSSPANANIPSPTFAYTSFNYHLGPTAQQATPSPTQSYITHYDTPEFNLSTDNLSLHPSEPNDYSVISPQALSSPFANQPGFLSIPSPRLGGGAHTPSPASSTFGGEGSIAYSDQDEFGQFTPSMPSFYPSDNMAENWNFGLAGHGTTTPQNGPSDGHQLVHSPYEAYSRAPSPFLAPGHFPYTGSTTPLSSSAPSPNFMPVHPGRTGFHQRSHSSVSSIPFITAEDYQQ